MAALSTNRIAWRYTADDTNVYVVAAQKAYTDQDKAGGAISDGTEPPLPYKMQMRRINVSDRAGHARSMPLYDPAPALKPRGVTVNLNLNNNSTVFYSTGSVRKEQDPRRSTIQQTT